MNKTITMLAGVALIVGLGGGLFLRASLREAPAKATRSSSVSDHKEHSMAGPGGGPVSRPAAETVATSRTPIGGKLTDIANSTCVIMGSDVNVDSFPFIYNGLLIRFCCAGCDTQFLKRPVELLKKMKSKGAVVPDAALAEAANPSVIAAGNKQCPVRGAEIADSRIFAVHHGVKVALCCEDCRADFAEDPGRYLRQAAKSGKIPSDRLSEEAR